MTQTISLFIYFLHEDLDYNQMYIYIYKNHDDTF